MRKISVGVAVLMSGLGLSLQAAERFKDPVEVSDTVNLSNFREDDGSRLVEWVYPAYPPEPGADWTEERVWMDFVVDAAGAVGEIRVRSGPERFRVAAEAAVKQWKFKPARKNGQPTPKAYTVAIPFRPTGTPPRSISADYELTQVHTPETSPPGDPYNSEPLYPHFLQARRLSGDVALMLGIDQEGHVDGVQVISAFHPDFLSAALDTVAAWECRPAHEGLLNVRGKKGVVLSFYTTNEEGVDNRADWMERNGIFLRAPAGRKIVEYFDAPVEAVRMVDPVYPYELALAGTTGGARVDFRVDAFGRVGDVAVAEATAPEFGAALAAAITAWQFKPLRRLDEVVTAEFSITWKFAPPRPESAEQRLLAELAGGGKPAGARELDRPLFPLYRRSPIFPPDRLNAGEGGRAEIEFIIDRTGRVRLPRIRGASEPAFGWAAMTAVSQWLFETPRKHGEPVDVRVAIPMEFAPPERTVTDPVDPIPRPKVDGSEPPVRSVP